MDDEGNQGGQIQVMENTYIMKPQEHEKFKANEVIKAVKALLDERLKGKKYDSNDSAQLSKELCTEIKEKVKEIGAPRHKLVVQVTIGEVQGQGVRIASRCLWDVETDNHASAYYTNPYLYCVAMVKPQTPNPKPQTINHKP
ncbi:flagellar outer dynein arm light chain 2 [Baffinella frigidus]|nr:flagellar outer dynein arm light chain 2 [Cryptophyta sp. CCMP2293]